jgi:hypothetical protein
MHIYLKNKKIDQSMFFKNIQNKKNIFKEEKIQKNKDLFKDFYYNFDQKNINIKNEKKLSRWISQFFFKFNKKIKKKPYKKKNIIKYKNFYKKIFFININKPSKKIIKKIIKKKINKLSNLKINYIFNKKNYNYIYYQNKKKIFYAKRFHYDF